MGCGKMLAFRGRITNQGWWSIGSRDALWEGLYKSLRDMAWVPKVGPNEKMVPS